MLKLNNVSKSFGSFTAVDNINLQVKKGEFYGFLGENGAGKTTTIKMITGLFSPTTGEIFINGYNIARDPIYAKRYIGYIPDQPFLYDKLTGREFLHFSGGLYKIEKKLLNARIDEMINELKLESWIDKRTEGYSQGMKQRITIASAMLHWPALIVVDEPMVGLDPQSALLVKNLLRKKAAEGAAVFMSTHSLHVAEELCSRIGIIKNGKIIFEDKKEIIEEMKNLHNSNFESVFIELTK
jgi:ABC-2 type transport system ATP-binding protein